MILFLNLIKNNFMFCPKIGDHYERGCIRDLSDDLKAECLENSDNCKFCEGKNCNTKKTFQVNELKLI